MSREPRRSAKCNSGAYGHNSKERYAPEVGEVVADSKHNCRNETYISSRRTLYNHAV